jgi:hypothetical protein
MHNFLVLNYRSKSTKMLNQHKISITIFGIGGEGMKAASLVVIFILVTGILIPFSMTIASAQQPVPNASLTVTKTGVPLSQSAPGTITWNVTVTNTGDVTLTNVNVTDSRHGMLGAFGSLAPGGGGFFTIVETNLPSGDYIDQAFASGYYDPENLTVIGFSDLIECEVTDAGAVRDVEAVSQCVIENEVEPGDLVDIDVTVRNNGDVTETFDLTCYYDSVEIGTILVVDLAPGESRVVTFTWDTNGVAVDEYSIKALADSSNEIVEVDEANNWCNMPLSIFVVPEMPLGTIATLISMMIATIGYISYKRHKTKQ